MVTLTVARLRNALKGPLSAILLVVLFLGSSSVPALAQADLGSPVLKVVVANANEPGTIMVSGTGFTQGGLVFIAIHDQWGMTAHETRWIVASTYTYQPPQGVDPGEGFSFDTGGNIGELFEIPMTTSVSAGHSGISSEGLVTGQPTSMTGLDCTTSLMVRAYDRTTATWSSVIDVELGC